MSSAQSSSGGENLLVQIASYNTNLQGRVGIPQDLVDWLSPTLQVSTFLANNPRAPDIVAVGFQELLPLHLGLSGLSRSVIEDRDSHIRSQIEANAPGKDSYTLVAKVVNVGVALLVYARDEGIGRKVCDVQTQWTGCGPAFMGNKGAVGIRFRVPHGDSAGETFTFVCAHLTAHEPHLAARIENYRHIVGSLLFPPPLSSQSSERTTIFSTSHLFFLGDLNFRLCLPPTHPLSGLTQRRNLAMALDSESKRAELKEYDQLLVEKRKGSIFLGLREGEFWRFPCTYKYELGEVSKYSSKRVPSWTDRILYTTHTDSPTHPQDSNIKNILYTAIPSYTTSDHKPIVALLLVPSNPGTTDELPLLRLPANYKPLPDSYAATKRYCGRTLDRMVGIIWWIFTLFGAGSAAVGIFNFLVGIGAWTWWKSASVSPSPSPPSTPSV